jgi:hypothetical protein
LVVERDDGKWSIGFVDDAPGPFESRRHAEAVANRYSGDDPPPKKRRRPRRANARALINRFVRAAATDKYATAETVTSPLFATGDCYHAVAPNGLLIGSFKSRPEATLAFSGVRS